MSDGRHRFFLALSWLWVTVAIGYMIWGAFTYAGLYRWLAELQIAQWGGYYRKWTAALPGIILALPALAYIGHRSRMRQAAEAASPAAQARTIKRAARYAMLLGLLGILIGGGAFAISQRLPDGSERAEPFDATRLGTAPAPAIKVRIRGTDDPAARTQVVRRGVDDRVTFYAGFRLEGEDKNAPLRLFIERNTPAPEGLTTLQAFLPEQTGYLVENGVPEEALEALRARGIRVANPHWLLQTGDLARREPYYIIAAVAGLIGLVCLLVGFATYLQGRRRAWLATAIRPDGRPVEGPPPAA
jgi:xanthosine utilization system XapX-like protein